MCSHVPKKKLRSCSVRDRNKEGLCLDSPVNQCCRMCRDVDVGGLCYVSWMTRWSFQTACVQRCWSWVDSTDKRSWWWRLALTPKTLKGLPKCWSRTTAVSTCERVHDPGQDVVTNHSPGSQQARDTTTAKAKDMWRDLSHVLPTMPTPMKGRNIMSIGKNTKSIGMKSPLSVYSAMSPRKSRKIWIPTTIVNTMMMSMSMKQLRWMQCLNLTVQKMNDRLERPYNSNLLPWLPLERQKERATPKARARARENLSARTWPWTRGDPNLPNWRANRSAWDVEWSAIGPETPGVSSREARLLPSLLWNLRRTLETCRTRRKKMESPCQHPLDGMEQQPWFNDGSSSVASETKQSSSTSCRWVFSI